MDKALTLMNRIAQHSTVNGSWVSNMDVVPFIGTMVATMRGSGSKTRSRATAPINGATLVST
jgi:hypothetical protein